MDPLTDMHIKFMKLFYAGLILVCLGLQPLQGASTHIRLTTLVPKGTSYEKTLQRMRSEWSDISQGEVRLTIYPGGIQGGESAMVDRMRINRTQAGLLTAVGLAKIVPEVEGLQSIPMLFNSLDEVEFILETFQDRISGLLKEKGFEVLFWSDAGFVRFFSREPINTPDDLRKMKLFTWVGDSKASEIYQKAGMNPVALETSDIPTGMATGLIDVVPMPPVVANVNQIYKTAPYMLNLDWAPLVGALVINSKTWDKISPAVQKKLKASAIEIGREMTQISRKEQEEAVRVMQDKWGLKVQEISPEIKQLWRETSEAVYPEIRGRIVPADMFDDVLKALRERRNEQVQTP